MLPSAVVFDVDGVLFDTEIRIRRAWEKFSAEMGWPQVAEHYLEYVGQNRNDIAARFLKEYGPGFDGMGFLIRCTDYCRQQLEDEGIPLKPGIMDILDYLKEKGVPMALATSTSADRTARRMELTGLGPYFQAIVTGDMVSHSKPDPEIYARACLELGVDPADTIAVEDAPNGIRSAHGAGMQVIMIPDLVPYTPELDPMLLTHLPSLTALRDYLRERE